jgi:Transcriptional regulator
MIEFYDNIGEKPCKIYNIYAGIYDFLCFLERSAVMNIQQLRIALAVAANGSISGAASSLFLSQPNVSSSIKSLEKELGYSIFNRTNLGIELTERGQLFINHARAVLGEVEKMSELSETAQTHRLRIGTSNYAPTIEAFLKLNEMYSVYPKVELSCENIPFPEGIKALYNLRLDILTMIIHSYLIDSLESNVKNHNLEVFYIKNIPMNVNLREGHPLAVGDEIDVSKLADYPYADYVVPGIIEGTNREMGSFINYKYRIATDERDTRCRIVSTTDAFSIGCKLPEAMLKRYNMVSYRLKGIDTRLCCIMRSGEKDREEIVDYLRLLNEEIAEI